MAWFGGGKPTAVTQDVVLDALRRVHDPNLGADIVTLGLVKQVAIQGGQVSFTLEFSGQQPPQVKVEIHSQARKAVGQLPGVTEVKAAMASKPQASRPGPGAAAAPREDLIPEVKQTVAVSSGKGGVGKSTVAVNLALALHGTGATVGLIDVGVYGPNITLMRRALGE